MSFTTISVQNNAPNCSGVYGLSNASEWLFVGEAGNIRNALMEHLRETNTALATHKPKGFSFEVSAANLRASRRNQLVRELAPSCHT